MENDMDLYMKEHLEKFIIYHLERGYELGALKKCLTKYGYSAREINSIANEIKIIPKKIDRVYSDKELDAETYFYLRGIIADYIKNQENQGFDKEHVKKALIKFGHSPAIVDDAMTLLGHKIRFKLGPSSTFIMIFLFLMAGVFMLSLLLGVPFRATVLVFSPGLIGYIAGYFLIEILNRNKQYAPPIALLITIGLFFLIFPALENASVDFNIVLILNAVMALVATWLFSQSFVPRAAKERPTKKK